MRHAVRQQQPSLKFLKLYSVCGIVRVNKGIQEAQLMLTTGSTRLAVSRGQQTWYHSTCYIQFPIVQ